MPVENKKERTKLDAFLSEYGLDNQEGVALMSSQNQF